MRAEFLWQGPYDIRCFVTVVARGTLCRACLDPCMCVAFGTVMRCVSIEVGLSVEYDAMKTWVRKVVLGYFEL